MRHPGMAPTKVVSVAALDVVTVVFGAATVLEVVLVHRIVVCDVL